MRTNAFWAWLGCLLISATTGCAVLFPAPKPLRTVWYTARAPDRPSSQVKGNLLVLLPGRADHADTFQDEGIISIANRAKPGLDIVTVEAGLGYYMRQSLVARLSEDIVGPARQRGYTRIYLAGVSMGGLGALLYAMQRPDEVSGVYAIAPFLANDEVLDEIEQAGGLSRWNVPATVAPGDWQRPLWGWLKGCAQHDSACPPIFLGYGRADKFARAHRLLGAALEHDHVFVADGGHEWDPWRRLFTSGIAPLLETRTASTGP